MKQPAALYGSAAALIAGGLLVAWNSTGDARSTSPIGASSAPRAIAIAAAAGNDADETADSLDALAQAGTLWEPQAADPREARRTAIQVAAAPLDEALAAAPGTRLQLALSKRFAPLDATVTASSRHEDGTVITRLRVEGSPAGTLTLQENTEAGFFLGQLYYDDAYPIAYQFRRQGDGIQASRHAVSDLLCSELDADQQQVKDGGLPAIEAGATLTPGKKDRTTTANAKKLNTRSSTSTTTSVGISVLDASVTEGDSGTANLNFSVRLSKSDRTKTISINYTTVNGSATAGSDYQAKSGTITFAPRTTSQTVTIPVIGDLLQEGNETLTLQLSNPVNATLTDGAATGTIVDNDSPPTLTVSNTTVTEGNSGKTAASVTVTLSKAFSAPVTVDYAAANASATVSSDYDPASGTLTFNPGETSKTVALAINGDTEIEGNETFAVNLSAASGAAIADGQGVVTIANDDATTSSSSNVPELHSLPDATAVIYLDMDGQVVSGTQWAGGGTIAAEGVDTTFTSAQMTEIWKRVSEDYAPFKVNVTTSEAAYLAAPTNRRIRCIITPTNEWYGNYGGVAYVGSFTWTGDTPCWVFSDALGNSTRYISEAAAHEIGHTLGLRHDGRTSPSEGYYTGHGSGEVSWAPIMGVGYYSSLVQWSKGEYLAANNTEDDLAIIAGTTNGFGYRADTIGNTTATAAELTVSGGTAGASGLLETRDDVDVFSFSTNGGSVSLAVRGEATSQNLDLLAEIHNASGQLVASANPDTLTDATVSATLPAGTYYLRISGVGRGSATSDGYTDYGSLGQYTVQGTIP